MAHCPYERLADVADVLTEIRSWPQIQEPRPGVFYVKRVAFLHFHLKDPDRWADVRDGADWGAPVSLPVNANASAKKKFLAEVSRRLRATTAA